MTPALRIIAPGVHTTVQGLERIGYRDIGVPASGPLDWISLRLANALVGNAHGTPGLEMLLQGPTCEVLADSVRLALVGCGASIEVRSGDARIVPAGQSIRLVRGEVFRVGPLIDSACAYVAIEGGLDIAPTLGSVSTYVRGAIGGFQGRRLQKGDILPLKLPGADIRSENALRRPLDLALDQAVRVVLGPQADYFTDEGVRTFLSSVYTVSPQSDRMGFRLDGPQIEHARDYNIVSDGVVSGSIQVPGSGRPIVLMVDNQTTGGYPKIATVISADIPVVGRRRPGRAIRFVSIDVREAELLRREQQAVTQHEIEGLRPLTHAEH
ncbi:MAG: biotin-dependent carboxyltransferase family protein [Betaproteobacteria bacterium]|nr:biotin-dependent carboxyltransferase family protein [Betaproteobacteria bacterium]